MAVITYISTFIGFISLIGKVFPIMGLFGFILLIPVLYKGLIKRITGKSTSIKTSILLVPYSTSKSKKRADEK